MAKHGACDKYLAHMENTDIFKFYRPSDYLEAVLQDRQKKRPKFSMSQFASFLKFPDVGTLSRVLGGRRALSMDRAVLIADRLELPHASRLYFFQMVALQDVPEEVRNPLLKVLQLQDSSRKATESESVVSSAEIISDYRYLSVRECLRLKKNSELHDGFSKVWKASPDTPNFPEIMQNLEKAQLVKNEDGQWVPHDPVALNIDPGESSRVIRSYHEGWLQSAQFSLLNGAMEKRNFQGTTLSIPKWAYAEVVEQIKSLHKNLLKLSLAKDADQVVHVESFVIPVGEAYE